MAKDSSAVGACKTVQAGVQAGSVTHNPVTLNGTGCDVVVDVTAVSGTTPTLVVKLQFLDGASSKWVDMPGATTAVINSVSTVTFQVYPGISAVANLAISRALPQVVRAVSTIGGTTPSFTYTIGITDVS